MLERNALVAATQLQPTFLFTRRAVTPGASREADRAISCSLRPLVGCCSSPYFLSENIRITLRHIMSYSDIWHCIVDDQNTLLPWIAVFMICGCLCVSAVISLRGTLSRRATSQRRGFWLALIPVLFGLFGATSQMSFSIESKGYNLNINVNWIFLVPILLGGASLFFWWKAKQDQPHREP